MKTCPNCKELIGDNAISCFNCYYDFNSKKVTSPQKERENKEKLIADELKHKEELKVQKEMQLSLNPNYEYKVEYINDDSNGSLDTRELQIILNNYAYDGWKLHSICINEIGKTGAGAATSFLGLAINATIDQTIIVFERCVKS